MTTRYQTTDLACGPSDRDEHGRAGCARRVTFDDLGEKHPTGMRWEVTVHHPPRVLTTEGRLSVQSPETFRFLADDEAGAVRLYRRLVIALGGKPDVDEPADAAAPVSREEYNRLLARLAALEKPPQPPNG